MKRGWNVMIDSSWLNGSGYFGSIFVQHVAINCKTLHLWYESETLVETRWFVNVPETDVKLKLFPSGWPEQQRTSAGTWPWCALPSSSTRSPPWPSPSCTSTTRIPSPASSTRPCCGSTWGSAASCPSLPWRRAWSRVSWWTHLHVCHRWNNT